MIVGRALRVASQRAVRRVRVCRAVAFDRSIAVESPEIENRKESFSSRRIEK